MPPDSGAGEIMILAGSVLSFRMNLTQLTSATYSAAAQKARWAKVKRAAGTGTAVKPVPQPKPAKVGRQKRGGLKDSVVALVKGTGQRGITVAEVGRQTGRQTAEDLRLVQVHRQGRQGDPEGGASQVRVAGLIAGDRAPRVPSSGDWRRTGVEVRWIHG
jgi:hypothetical protein